MTELKSANSIVVLVANPQDPVEVNVAKAARQNTTGITELADMPNNDVAMHLLGTNLQTEYNKFKQVPPTSIKQTVNKKINLCCAGYNANAAFLQTAARAKAIETGDVNDGIAMVRMAGFYLKEPKSSTNKDFEVKSLGGGEVWIITKAVGTGAGYIREYGLTTEKGIPPTIKMQLLFSMESDLLLTGLKVGGIYAMREASILPIPRSSGGSSEPTNVEEPATRAAISKNRKRIYTAADGEETSNYVWSDWIYFVVL